MVLQRGFTEPCAPSGIFSQGGSSTWIVSLKGHFRKSAGKALQGLKSKWQGSVVLILGPGASAPQLLTRCLAPAPDSQIWKPSDLSAGVIPMSPRQLTSLALLPKSPSYFRGHCLSE